MTHPAAPPAVVMAIVTAVAPLWTQLRAQMKALNLLYSSKARDWCQEGIKVFRLATWSDTTRIH